MPQTIPQKRTSKRILQQTVDVPLQDIPQERILERIVEHIVPVPQGIPQERISERIVEQTIDFPLQGIPQERISERIAGQIVDGPGRGTSSSSAAALGDAECPNYGVFRTFPRGKKSATSGPESSANLVSHSSSWPPAAYEVEEPAYEHFDHADMAWRRRWSYARSAYEYWFLDPDGCWIGPGLKGPLDLWG